jgi:glycerol transport system ATP-binding protein
MARIELKDVWHSYEWEQGEKEHYQWAVEDINVIWEEGTANALLGPSGCGKTTLLKIISGLTDPTRGQVFFDGKDVTGLSAKQRHIAQVFQFPVVYDSMNVFGNLAFPLVNDGESDEYIQQRVREVAEIMEITSILGKPAGRLNPADKQRVSLGRGIVRPNTAAVLLDEPLTVIDPKAQWGLRRKLKEVQEQLGFTMIYVTHDQHEALTFADYVTVMQVGRNDQNGSPEELHETPQSTFVGYFIGSPGMNMSECTVSEDGTMRFGTQSYAIDTEKAKQLVEMGEEFTFGIRPEYVELSEKQKSGWIAGEVKLVEDTGAYRIITVTVDEVDIKARATEESTITEGDTVWLNFPGESLHFFQEGKKVV